MKKIRRNRLITLLLFVFMVCFGVIAFIKSDFFALKNIKILNNNMLTKSEVKDLSKIAIGKNIFTYDLKKINSNIRESTYIKDVTVKRKIPNSILINIQEKQISCVLKNNNNIYDYVDKNMVYIDKVKKENIKENYPIVSVDFFIKDNQIYFKRDKDKKYLINLVDNINRQELNKKIDSIDFFKDDKVSLKIGNSMEVVIDENKDVKHDMSRLTKILVDLQSQNINYGKIDMTFSKYDLYTY